MAEAVVILGDPVTIQQIIETLLRSRLYRTRVTIEMETGESHAGCVADIRYDGPRSEIVLDERTSREPTRLLLARVSRVVPASSSPRSGAA